MIMIKIGLSVAIGLGLFFLLEIKHRKAQKKRDTQFRAVMAALEEKAKKEGTFTKSYFN